MLSTDKHRVTHLCFCTSLQVMTALKQTMWGSVHRDAPMLVVLLSTFEKFGKIPRSSDHQTVLLSKVQGFKVVYISHRWRRPWHTEKECTENGHEWAGDLLFSLLSLSVLASPSSPLPDPSSSPFLCCACNSFLLRYLVCDDGKALQRHHSPCTCLRPRRQLLS